MAINTNLSIESNKQNKQEEQKQNHRYKKYFDGYQMGGCWVMGEKGKGIKKQILVVTT